MTLQHYIKLVEEDQRTALTNGLLYRGTLEVVTEDYLKRNAMIGHTVHFIPEVNHTVRGLSTSFDPTIWGRRYRFIWVLDGSKITNAKWAFKGQAAYELTGHMQTKPAQDTVPAWQQRMTTKDYLHAYQMSKPDEIFINGDLEPITAYCVKMIYRKTDGWTKLKTKFFAFAEQHSIPIEKATWD